MRKSPPTTRRMSATPARAMPMMSTGEDFFFGLASSSPSSSTAFLAGLPLPLAGAPFFIVAVLPLVDLPLADLPFFLTAAAFSSSASSSASGDSTTKRYLHLGQSILRPIRLLSLIGTCASQLGHCCLKL